jgi:preprotein translocase subunit SecG
MYQVLVVVQVVAAIAVIGLVLIQHGKGADAGAAFGSGASGTVFGARGSANFLTRATAVCATIFFAVSLSLAYLVQAHRGGSESVIDTIPAAKTAPATTPAIPDQKPATPAAGTQPATPKVPE